MFRSVDNLLRPSTVAIVGASERGGAGWPLSIWGNLEQAGFPVRVYLINITEFDLVNSWDLFHSLAPGQIGALSEYLRAFVREQSLWTSLIWIHKRIPAQPQRFAIIDEETVEYRPTSRSERTGPLYKEPALLKAMKSYRAGKSFLLRHGIQEYVFEPRHPVPSGGTDWGG